MLPSAFAGVSPLHVIFSALRASAALPFAKMCIKSSLFQVKKKGLKQKDAARMIGISATTFSDLLHGRRSLSFDIARNLHKVLGVPEEVVLA